MLQDKPESMSPQISITTRTQDLVLYLSEIYVYRSHRQPLKQKHQNTAFHQLRIWINW